MGWVAAAGSILGAGCGSEGGTHDAPAERRGVAGENAPVVVGSEVAEALGRAGDNRGEIERAIRESEGDQRRGMEWLVARMPEDDLRSLKADFLLTNAREAYAAWKAAPWRAEVDEEVFLDAVLPYASVNEAREDWRTGFRERFWPLVRHAKTAGEAAVILNQKIFADLNVKYSTRRNRADQAPSETMSTGLASCTGLSILLIDACRSVGIPARFVGTPLWADGSGNHSWVEVWDNGWHFTGAAEPTGDSLDGGWFVDRASQAKVDDRSKAIYATTWKESPIWFPLVWDIENHGVRAVNVTDRYTVRGEKIPAGSARVGLRVRGGDSRVRREVVVRGEDGAEVAKGMSKDERFDGNDHLTAVLKVGSKYTASCEGCGDVSFRVEREGQVVDLVVK